jgi:hypothetical protein
MPEPSPASFVSVSLTLLMAVSRALSSLYDEAFVLVTTAAVVASLGQSPTQTRAPGVQAAAKIRAFFTVLAAAAERSCFSWSHVWLVV